jgi:CRISPR-associated protein Cmr3
VQAAQPDAGCLINPDELSGFVRNLFNEQQRGRGDELSRLLSIYDGRPLRGNFSDKSLNYNLKGSSFSLLSTIQPSVLLECMGDLNDASGLWARFNLCEIPPQRRRMTRSGRSGDGLMPALQNTYLCLQEWEPRTYGLDDEAAELFDTFYDSCEDQRLDQTLESALQAYAAKQEGRCGRIALVLHCLQAAAKKTPPAHQISAETMLGAITICDFYQQQLKRFYSLALAQVGDSLEGNTLLVFNFIKNAGGKTCSVREINKGPRALRKLTKKEIEQSLELLTGQNLAKQTSDGWSIRSV